MIMSVVELRVSFCSFILRRTVVVHDRVESSLLFARNAHRHIFFFSQPDEEANGDEEGGADAQGKTIGAGDRNGSSSPRPRGSPSTRPGKSPRGTRAGGAGGQERHEEDGGGVLHKGGVLGELPALGRASGEIQCSRYRGITIDPLCDDRH